MTLVIIAAEIDISVGSAIGFTSALLGVTAVNHGWPLGLAVVFALAVSAGIGLTAGAVRARFGVPSFIVTLALFSALDGMALRLTDAIQRVVRPGGSGDWQGAPIPGMLLIVTFALFGEVFVDEVDAQHAAARGLHIALPRPRARRPRRRAWPSCRRASTSRSPPRCRWRAARAPPRPRRRAARP